MVVLLVVLAAPAVFLLLLRSSSSSSRPRSLGITVALVVVASLLLNVAVLRVRLAWACAYTLVVHSFQVEEKLTRLAREKHLYVVNFFFFFFFFFFLVDCVGVNSFVVVRRLARRLLRVAVITFLGHDASKRRHCSADLHICPLRVTPYRTSAQTDQACV